MITSLTRLFTELAKRYEVLLYSFLVPIALSYFLGKAIVNQNYYHMLFVVVAFLGFLMLRSNILTISIILFLAFFGNWLEFLGYLPGQFIWLVEIVTILLLLKALLIKSLRSEKIQLKFIRIFILFLSVSIISYFVNHASFIHAFLFFRLLFRYYLLYLAIINLDIAERQLKIINGLIIFLFLIQVPTAFIKYFLYGQGERAIGTYGYHGGELSTVLPLISISFLIAFYFFFKTSKFYIFLAFCFIAFGLVGGKKAIIIFVPVLILYLGFLMKDQARNVLKYLIIGTLIVVLTGFFSMTFVKKLKSGYSGREGISLSYLTEFFVDYTTRTNSAGQSGGRAATTINVYNILRSNGIANILFGFGPGSYIETRFGSLQTTLKEQGELPIAYGVTGLSWLVLQVGYLGALIYLAFFYVILVYCLHFFKRERRPYWKSIGFGMVGFSFVMLLISLAYSPILINDLVPMIFFLLAASVFIEKEKKSQTV